MINFTKPSLYKTVPLKIKKDVLPFKLSCSPKVQLTKVLTCKQRMRPAFLKTEHLNMKFSFRKLPVLRKFFPTPSDKDPTFATQ